MDENTIMPLGRERAQKTVKAIPVPKTFCVICSSPTELVAFKNRFICRECIDMTKRFHEWQSRLE